MHIVRRIVPAAQAAAGAALATVTLTIAQRRRTRQRIALPDGDEIALSLAERDTVLHTGDELVADDGARFRVQAAVEHVLRVTADNARELARAAYHLGNRHVQLEVGAGYLQLEFDQVLVDMLHQLGTVQVARVEAPFEPETGAYGGGHHHGGDEGFAEDYALAQAAYHAHDAAVGVHTHVRADGSTYTHTHDHPGHTHGAA